MSRPSKPAADILAAAPPLPLNEDHWRKIFKAMKLSAKQIQIVELMLRDLSDWQIAKVLGISESTVATHQDRIRQRTGAGGRMQLAMHILAVSHQVCG